MMIEKNELTLWVLDPNLPGKLLGKKINEDYPLYPLLEFLQNIETNPQANHPGFVQFIQAMKNETLEKIHQTKWKLNSSDVKTLEICVEWIGSTLDKTIATASLSNQVKIIETIVYITESSLRQMSKKHQKNKSHRIMGHFLSQCLRRTSFLYFKENQIQLAETYCVKHIEHLSTLKINDVENMKQSRFFSDILFARIYLKFGHSKLAMDFFQKANQTFDKNFYEASDGFTSNIDIFLDLYKEMMVHIYNNQEILELFEFYVQFIKKISVFDNNPERKKIINFINLIFAQAKDKYKKKFEEAIAKSPGTEQLVENFVFNFDKNLVTLHFKNPDLNQFFSQAFKQNKVNCKQLEGTEPNSWFQFSIHLCSAEKLEKICQKVLALQKQEEETGKFIPLIQITPETLTPVALPLTLQPEIPVTATAHFSTPLFQSAPEKPIKIKPTVQKNSANTSSAPQPKTICYQWASGLQYDSSEKNEGVVKMLSNHFIPEGVWFGYIPQWLTEDPHFNAEFSRKLSRGLIGHDCIRDITKELQTWNNQNFSVEHPYKFKIVVKNYDYRVYGWIDEVLTGEDGKKHYLVCFGYLANHKANYLPDPETLKKKLSEEKTLKM